MTKEEASDLRTLHDLVVQRELDVQSAEGFRNEAVRRFETYLAKLQEKP